ncbi:hypothetical protein ACFC96_09270 [Streptomyces sp. NPDC055955]|uniref:hypothetical protein n=1 Tax=Streptomyces sp. NPDC055955 TaxID=3345665 RepID=UPI0035E364C7
MRRACVFGVAGAVLLATGGITACQGDASADPAGAARVVKETDDEAVVELSDGRRVSLRYQAGTGLLERHRSARGKPWSTAKTVYATKTDPCRGIDLKAQRATVTVRADFGQYCRDGEPPTESVAAVGTGGPGKWDTHLAKDWDGWDRVDIARNGKSATFSTKSSSGTTTLEWRAGKGFGEVVTTYKKLGARFLGTWRAEDGSHQVTFRQSRLNVPASATVETLKGPTCKVRMDLINIWEDRVQPRRTKVLEGEKTTYCPPEEFNSEYVVATADGPMELRNLGDATPLVTYRKS